MFGLVYLFGFALVAFVDLLAVLWCFDFVCLFLVVLFWFCGLCVAYFKLFVFDCLWCFVALLRLCLMID